MSSERINWQKIFTPTAVDEAENESAGSAGQRWWQGSSSFDFRREERQLELAQREVKPGMAVEVQGMPGEDVGGRRFCSTGGDWQVASLLQVEGIKAFVEHRDVFEDESGFAKLKEWVPLHALRPLQPERFRFREKVW